MKKILLGNDAIIEGALASGVAFVSGYPGCPSAEIGDNFGKIAKEGVYPVRNHAVRAISNGVYFHCVF